MRGYSSRGGEAYPEEGRVARGQGLEEKANRDLAHIIHEASARIFNPLHLKRLSGLSGLSGSSG